MGCLREGGGGSQTIRVETLHWQIRSPDFLLNFLERGGFLCERGGTVRRSTRTELTVLYKHLKKGKERGFCGPSIAWQKTKLRMHNIRCELYFARAPDTQIRKARGRGVWEALWEIDEPGVVCSVFPLRE